MDYKTFSKILHDEHIFDEMIRMNLFVETCRVVSNYERENSSKVEDYFIGLFVCLFHELGKPRCMTEDWDEIHKISVKKFEKLNIISSRLAEDIMVRHGFNSKDIYRICWLIENWDVNIHDKMFGETITRYIGYDLFQMFIKAKTRYNRLFVPIHRDINKPKARIYFPIAASATGKSTLCEAIMKDNGEFIKTRYDSLRKELYGDNGKNDYGRCIELASEDPEWENIAESIYIDMLKSGKNVLFDNCNVTYDDRRHQIKLAREYGYETVALTFPIDLVTLKQRQDNRRTKLTPWVISESQYFELQQPMCGIEEFDYVVPMNCV